MIAPPKPQKYPLPCKQGHLTVTSDVRLRGMTLESCSQCRIRPERDPKQPN